MNQQTLATSIRARGKGWSTNKPVSISLKPAELNNGISFVSSNGEKVVNFSPADAAINFKNLSNVIVGFELNSARDLLAAIYGLGIDNIIIKLDFDELPVLNNGTVAFVFLIQAAGIRQQLARKNSITLNKPVMVTSGDKWAKLLPGNKLRLACDKFDLETGLNSNNSACIFDFSKALFLSEICRARPLAIIQKERSMIAAELLHTLGGKNRYTRLRRESRFRELLEVISDLAFLGMPINADYISYKADSALNIKLLRKLFKTNSANIVNGRFNQRRFNGYEVSTNQVMGIL